MNRNFLGLMVSRNGARLKVADKASDKLKDRVWELRGCEEIVASRPRCKARWRE
jgi:hypothetical protein